MEALGPGEVSEVWAKHDRSHCVWDGVEGS
jgi:hypothetical protein